MLVRVNALCTFWQSCLIVVAVAHGAVWIALLFVALSGGTNCIQAPAVGAAIPGLVDEANLVAANGKIDPNGQVLGFIPVWRALVDSNH